MNEDDFIRRYIWVWPAFLIYAGIMLLLQLGRWLLVDVLGIF